MTKSEELLQRCVGDAVILIKIILHYYPNLELPNLFESPAALQARLLGHNELADMLGVLPPTPALATAALPAKKPRTMSPEARVKIGAAQKKRWAKSKARKAAALAAGKPKTHKRSAATRKNMSKGQKERWARVHEQHDKGALHFGPAPTASGTRRRLSAKGLANIRRGVKKRVALYKQERENY